MICHQMILCDLELKLVYHYEGTIKPVLLLIDKSLCMQTEFEV